MSTSKESGQAVEVVAVKRASFGATMLQRIRLVLSRKHNRRLRFGVAAIVIVALAAVLYWFFMRDTSPPVATGKDLTKIKQASQVADVVQDYSADYSQAASDLQRQSYTNWNRTTLDKAYFSLIYADKIGAFSQVYNTLILIDAAKQTGVDIDDNSYGMDQKGRDEIRQRADVNAQKARGSHGG